MAIAPPLEKVRQRCKYTMGKGGCWLWFGSHVNDYPIVKIAGKTTSCRRYVYKLKTGKTVPRGKVVVPKCGNVSCLNPDHLYLEYASASYPWDKWLAQVADGKTVTLTKGKHYKCLSRSIRTLAYRRAETRGLIIDCSLHKPAKGEFVNLRLKGE